MLLPETWAMQFWPAALASGLMLCAAAVRAEETHFSRHVVAVFSRLGCNGGACHGAVQGQNGFRLSLFGARPEQDYEQIALAHGGRRIDRLKPEESLLLRKVTGQVPHQGGRRLQTGSVEYEALLRWIAQGAPLDEAAKSRLVALQISPREQDARSGSSYPLRVVGRFADGSQEDVTALCSYTSLDESVATVDASGRVQAHGVGDAAIVVRFRADPVVAQVVVARDGAPSPAEVAAFNFIDEQVLAKLRRLNIPPAELADDATFLRRARLDVTGKLPTPLEVREFLADADPQKRTRKIDQLLADPGHAALWTLKFCDLLSASDFGVYADGLAEHYEAPRFQAWVRARLAENTPFDEFAARILTATSREGRSLEDWAAEVVALQEGYKPERTDLDLYARRQTLEAYWQRRDAVGVAGTLQIAHAFLGLRLECAKCHRHPHDIWQQDDVLSFANFFMGVRTVGFQGDNEKRYPEESKVAKQISEEAKKLAEEVKQLKEGRAKELAEKTKNAKATIDKLKAEIAKDPDAAAAEAKRTELSSIEQLVAENDVLQRELRDKERRSKMLADDVTKRILHAQILYESRDAKSRKFAQVKSPLGEQSSQVFRLLGESEPLAVAEDEDPRTKVVEWLRRPDNPYFAKAIVNRVWAHYFGRGIVHPPDDLSPYNPATHPALLDELCRQFIEHRYDLRWLHCTILASRTYQQASQPAEGSEADRSNYASFYLRRLPAEVLVDVLNQATQTHEDFDMKYFHWPEGLTTVEAPYMPRNKFVTFVLEQFGRPARNSSVQCDCARQTDASLLQVLTLANHPRVWQKIAHPAGRVAEIVKQAAEPRERIEELYLSTLSRPPSDAELAACLEHASQAESPEKGLQAVLWSLLNTREFLLQH
jgi:hypothetical protein